MKTDILRLSSNYDYQLIKLVYQMKFRFTWFNESFVIQCLNIDVLSISTSKNWHTKYIRKVLFDILGLSRMCGNRLPYMCIKFLLNISIL